MREQRGIASGRRRPATLFPIYSCGGQPGVMPDLSRSKAVKPGIPAQATTRRSASLVRHRLGRRRGGLRVEVPAAGLLRPEVGADLVDERDAGRDVQPGDLVVGDAVEVLDQRPQRVAVRDDQQRGSTRDRGTIASCRSGSIRATRRRAGTQSAAAGRRSAARTSDRTPARADRRRAIGGGGMS